MLIISSKFFPTTKIILVAVTLGTLIAWAANLTMVTAHGGSIYLAKSINEYEIIMRASPPQPRVGTWHLSFAISHLDKPIGPSEANVVLETFPILENGTVSKATASQTIFSAASTYDDQFHDANMEFQEIGRQMLIIKVVDNSQTEMLLYQTAIDVKKPSTNQTIILFVVALPIIIVLLWVTIGWIRKKKPNHSAESV